MNDILVYNIEDAEKRKRIGFAASQMKKSLRDVRKEEQELPIFLLLSDAVVSDRKNRAPGESPEPGSVMPEATAFTEEMLLLNAFSDEELTRFLQLIRSLNAGVSLKAVLTPHNIGWSSRTLYAHLREEHEAFRKKKD